MARKTLREPKVDTELAYAYAKTDRLHDMEDFLSMTNVADVLEVGEKCFNDQLYQAAKLLFSSISNWAKLATTLIYLGRIKLLWRAPERLETHSMLSYREVPHFIEHF